MSVRDVLIVGGGPAGLATAIASRHLGLDYLVVEKGTVADAIYRFPTHMVFFTTPELLEIGGLPLTTPYEKPTRLEALRYYRRVVDTYQLQVALHEEVTAVNAAGDGDDRLFEVETRSARGHVRVREARAVVLAMGYYGRPNLLGIPGEDLPHVTHYYGEAHPVLPPAGGDRRRQELRLRSGARTAPRRRARDARASRRGVGRLGEVLGAARHREPHQGGLDRRPVLNRGRGDPSDRTWSCGAPASSETDTIPAEGVLLLTGYQADPGFLQRAGVELDPETNIPRHHADTFETNVPNLFIAGGQLAGRRTGTIFIENGRFHGEQVAKVLAARLRAE